MIENKNIGSDLFSESSLGLNAKLYTELAKKLDAELTNKLNDVLWDELRQEQYFDLDEEIDDQLRQSW